MDSFIPNKVEIFWTTREKPNKEPMSGKNIKEMNENENYSRIVIPAKGNIDSKVRCPKRDNMITAKSLELRFPPL